MCNIICYIIWLFHISVSSSTDLAAVYRDHILILRDADSILPNSTLQWESTILSLPRTLSYPVGLTQDTHRKRLFVAEARPKEETKIFSISLDSDFKVVEMTSAVKSKYRSVIEGMSYNPQSNHLYWTDASNHHIYEASLSSEDDNNASTPKLIEHLGSRNAPRGLGFDPCNEVLYWSEGGASGEVASSLVMWDPDDNRHNIIQQNEGKEDFYQGLTYDDISGNLVWAVTHGKDLNSTCRIVTTSLSEMHHQELVHLKNCYPFSLTVDENYVYWADWSRQGIMRVSQNDPSDVIKLLHTPNSTTNGDKYFGVYGLAKIFAGNLNQSPCQFKKKKNHHENYSKNPVKILDSGTAGEGEKNPVKVSEVHEDSKEQVEVIKSKERHYVQNATEETVVSSEEHAESERKSENATKEYKTKSANPDHTIQHLAIEETNVDNNNVYEDEIVKILRETLTDSEIDSSSVNSVTRTYDGKTQSAMIPSQSSSKETTTDCILRHDEGYLVKIIVILAVISVTFLCTTTILAILLYRSKAVSLIENSVSVMEPPQAVVIQPTRQVKRFGPKKSFVSVNKSKLPGSSTCSGLADDGVNINIEDCCQMTLCETPCYTSVKKQGKSYKDVRKNYKTHEDKKGLLDDSEEI